ncbi:MAG: hypothetical protein OHK0022_02870 [Roseiflexaceae bacterium]
MAAAGLVKVGPGFWLGIQADLAEVVPNWLGLHPLIEIGCLAAWRGTERRCLWLQRGEQIRVVVLAARETLMIAHPSYLHPDVARRLLAQAAQIV